MKIGIITFHWATNYGAVLQAYALQTYLTQCGHEVGVIDYVPHTQSKKLSKCFLTKRLWLVPSRLLEYVKELRLNQFRRRYLNLSGRYHSSEELQRQPPECDAYVCGSDQIWNPHFTAKGERKPTLSYFLAFGPENVKRVAYAASFGCTEYPDRLVHLILPDLRKFNAISVRESSGCGILRKIGVENISLVPDPTLLLTVEDYNRLISVPKKKNQKYTFFYALHSGQKPMEQIKSYLKKQLRFNIVGSTAAGSGAQGITGWLGTIKSAQAVVTNSFHGVAFAILFKRPFIAVPVKGRLAGMNDRFLTLLGNLGLEDHILEQYDPDHIDALLTRQMNWTVVDSRVDALRREAETFFRNSLC